MVLKTYPGMISAPETRRTLGEKSYELGNHLGNVLAVISDRKLIADDGVYNASGTKTSSTPDGIADYFNADLLSATDYYAFGAPMPGRQFNTANYRYGFNGKENDNEVKGTGGQQDYGMRIYDARLGKFLSVDPITKDYPELTPYQFASNTPIVSVDIDGLEASAWGYIAAFSGYDPNTRNQTGVAKQAVSDFKEVMKNPKTYETAGMAVAQMGVGMLAGIFTEGVGSSLLARNLARNYKMPAVSTAVDAPLIESSVISDITETEAAATTLKLKTDNIKFSQSSVNDVSEITASMKKDGWKGAPIDVVELGNGEYGTMNNTRVLAAHQAGIDVEANPHPWNEKLGTQELRDLFTTKKGTPETWGDAYKLRIGKQNAEYRKANPSGSYSTGGTGTTKKE